MREIKYKAFLTTSQKMFDVYALTFDMNGDLENVLLRTGENGSTTVPLLVVHLLQYTGLKDKNGDEIYEGDILQETDSDGDVLDTGVMKYEDGMFNICNSEGCLYYLDSRFIDDYIIKGNIYENPNLLTQ